MFLLFFFLLLLLFSSILWNVAVHACMPACLNLFLQSKKKKSAKIKSKKITTNMLWPKIPCCRVCRKRKKKKKNVFLVVLGTDIISCINYFLFYYFVGRSVVGPWVQLIGSWQFIFLFSLLLFSFVSSCRLETLTTALKYSHCHPKCSSSDSSKNKSSNINSCCTNSRGSI